MFLSLPLTFIHQLNICSVLKSDPPIAPSLHSSWIGPMEQINHFSAQNLPITLRTKAVLMSGHRNLSLQSHFLSPLISRSALVSKFSCFYVPTCPSPFKLLCKEVSKQYRLSDLWTTETNVSQLQRLGSSRKSHQQILCIMRPHFLVQRQPSSRWVFTWWEDEGALWGLFYKGSNIIHKGTSSWTNHLSKATSKCHYIGD